MPDPTNRGPVLRTERLVLRPWRDEDLEPFAAINGDPGVMEYFPSTLSPAESDDLAAAFGRGLPDGFGVWAVEIPGVTPFAGSTGLLAVGFPVTFHPAVEIGWRFAERWWGRGYATEAAAAALDYGFGERGLDEIVSFTAAVNRRSRRVMERLGMHRDPADDFEHLRIPAGNRLRDHVVYRLGRGEWTKAGPPAARIDRTLRARRSRPGSDGR